MNHRTDIALVVSGCRLCRPGLVSCRAVHLAVRLLSHTQATRRPCGTCAQTQRRTVCVERVVLVSCAPTRLFTHSLPMTVSRWAYASLAMNK
jgi:hypothetical protein